MSRPVNGGDVFRAVAHPTRRRILEVLRKGERTAGDLASQFRISFPSFSNHLRVLREAGLVKQRRLGSHRKYRLQTNKLRLIDSWIGRMRIQRTANGTRS